MNKKELQEIILDGLTRTVTFDFHRTSVIRTYSNPSSAMSSLQTPPVGKSIVQQFFMNFTCSD